MFSQDLRKKYGIEDSDSDDHPEPSRQSPEIEQLAPWEAASRWWALSKADAVVLKPPRGIERHRGQALPTISALLSWESPSPSQLAQFNRDRLEAAVTLIRMSPGFWWWADVSGVGEEVKVVERAVAVQGRMSVLGILGLLSAHELSEIAISADGLEKSGSCSGYWVLEDLDQTITLEINENTIVDGWVDEGMLVIVSGVMNINRKRLVVSRIMQPPMPPSRFKVVTEESINSNSEGQRVMDEARRAKIPFKWLFLTGLEMEDRETREALNLALKSFDVDPVVPRSKGTIWDPDCHNLPPSVVVLMGPWALACGEGSRRRSERLSAVLMTLAQIVSRHSHVVKFSLFILVNSVEGCTSVPSILPSWGWLDRHTRVFSAELQRLSQPGVTPRVLAVGNVSHLEILGSIRLSIASLRSAVQGVDRSMSQKDNVTAENLTDSYIRQNMFDPFYSDKGVLPHGSAKVTIPMADDLRLFCKDISNLSEWTLICDSQNPSSDGFVSREFVMENEGRSTERRVVMLPKSIKHGVIAIDIMTGHLSSSSVTS